MEQLRQASSSWRILDGRRGDHRKALDAGASRWLQVVPFVVAAPLMAAQPSPKPTRYQ
jgi:hypothetical protein